MRSDFLIQDLEYADDMVIVNDSMDALEEVLRSMNDFVPVQESPSAQRKLRSWLFAQLPRSVSHLDLSN